MTRTPNAAVARPVATARRLILAALAAAAGAAGAHVTLPPGGAAAGSLHDAAFRVGHACGAGTVTTAVQIRLPAGFDLIEARTRPGWSVATDADGVTWTAHGAGLADGDRSPFVLRGQVTDTPGTLWFRVRQTCDRGAIDWAQVPSSESDRPRFPAARLDVVPPGTAAVDVRDAWARATVAGQSAGGVFARLTAPAGARLIGGSSPVAERVEVHEMRLDGDVMRMRALNDGLALAPGVTVALAPGGHHLMLQGLRYPLQPGASVAMELLFVDPQGRTVRRTVQVPVRAAGPGGGDGAHHHP